MTLLCQIKEQINYKYNKVFKNLINEVETYGVTFNGPRLVLHQLARNGVVSGADGDVLGAANPAQIAVAKATIVDSMKVAIFLYGANGHKYKQLKNDLENELSKGKVNYPPIVETFVHFLNTYKIKFECTKKGVNLMSDD